MYAGPRTHIDDMIGSINGLFIMLNDDHGVAHVAQLLQRCQQSFVIPLMQAYGRFIQDIHDADQPRAYLTCQTYPLRLATRQGFRTPVQGQVIQTNVDQETQPVFHFFQYARGDFPAPSRDCQTLKKCLRLHYRHGCDYRQVGIIHKYIPGCFIKALPGAGRARLTALVLIQFFPDHH